MFRAANPILYIASFLASCFGMALGHAQSSPIPCDGSPFGKSDLIIQSDQMLSLFQDSTHAYSGFDEYNVPPQGTSSNAPAQAYRSALMPGQLAGGFFLTAATVDLNGDGREEVAVAYQMPDNSLKIGVFERTSGFVPSANLLGVWTMNNGEVPFFNTVRMIGGEFAGTGTRQQQLAVAWKTSAGPNAGRLHAIVLTGGATGAIANPDNLPSGEWHGGSTPNANNKMDIARGDFLLDGRDQIAVVSDTLGGANETLYYDLLEFDSVNPGLPVQSGDTAIGSVRFQSNISTFTDDAATPASLVGGSQGSLPIVTNSQISRLVATGGDVVDSAADELVVHLAFQGQIVYPGSFGNQFINDFGPWLGQRLVHFVPTRSGPGAPITQVDLASSGSGRDFDNSQILNPRYSYMLQNFTGSVLIPLASNNSADFDAAIGRVDGLAKAKIVVVHPDFDTASRAASGQLVVAAYAADLRLYAGFQYAALGASGGSYYVQFTNTTTGTAAGYTWTFGDGDTSNDPNPSKAYANEGTYAVTLTVADGAGHSSQYSSQVIVDTGTHSGGAAASYYYNVGAQPVYAGATQNPPMQGTITTTNNFSGFLPRIAIGDVNRDGLADVQTVSAEVTSKIDFANPFNPVVLQQVWRSVWSLNAAQLPITFGAVHNEETIPLTTGALTSSVLASDFDGDSVFATLGTDCRAVSESQLRGVVWLPPYYAMLQGGAASGGFITSSFGNTVSGGSDQENRTGSHTDHDISGYLGGGVGGNVVLASFSDTLKFTAGHNWQSSHGSIHDSETDATYSEGMLQNTGDALVVAEEDKANCYSYDTVQTGGPVPDSTLRMCEITGQDRVARSADGWNLTAEQGSGLSDNWVPLQRDWSNLALFRPVASNAQFTSDGGPEKATDGKFSTTVVGSAITQPYLEIDLGSLQNIASIRVFPAANTHQVGTMDVLDGPLAFTRAAPALLGFKVYASAAPFAGPGVPSGNGIAVYAPETLDGSIYDRWNISTVGGTGALLKARYIRLQHPASVAVPVTVSQIQVYGDTHADPPAYPQAVCDPVANSGYFLAKVWNPVGGPQANGGPQNIEVRGDMVWTGTNGVGQATGVTLPNGQPCTNDAAITQVPIWSEESVGDSGSLTWSAGSGTRVTNGAYSNFDSTTRVGAAFDQEFSALFAKEVAGLAYQYSFGVTKGAQTTSFYGNDLQIGGAVKGFDAAFNAAKGVCDYSPQPYAYRLIERGNASYLHDFYVVDYIVQPAGTGNWAPGNVPPICSADYGDVIFANGFDLN